MSELKARHRHTTLGVLWTLLQPISMMFVFTLVFSFVIRVHVSGYPYPLFAYVGLISWMFLSQTLVAGTTSVVNSMNLVTKANFPREVIPLAKVLAHGFDFAVGWGCLVVLVYLYGLAPKVSWLALPFIAAVHVAFTVGMVLWGAALHVLKRDVGSVLQLLLQVWMYLSPVVYPVELIPEQYRFLYLLNPMATIIEAYRSVMIVGVVPVTNTMVAGVLIAAVACSSGYVFFKAAEDRFADIM